MCPEEQIKRAYLELYDNKVQQKLNNPYKINLKNLISTTLYGLVLAHNEAQKAPWHIDTDEEIEKELKKYDESNFEFIEPEPKLSKEQKNYIKQGAEILKKMKKLTPETSTHYESDIINHKFIYNYLRTEFVKQTYINKEK